MRAIICWWRGHEWAVMDSLLGTISPHRPYVLCLRCKRWSGGEQIIQEQADA